MSPERNFFRHFFPALLLSTLHFWAPTNGDHQDAAIEGEKTAYACHGARLFLQCSEADNEVIKVTRANYGRFSIAVCNDKSMTTWSVNCYSPRAKDVLESNCNNYGECEISASDFDFGSNPCPDTERYLEASYICVQTELSKGRAPSSTEPQQPPRLSRVDFDEQQQARSSLNSSRRKPVRRVPITAPPSTRTTFISWTTTTSRTTTVTSDAASYSTNATTTPSPITASSGRRPLDSPTAEKNHHHSKENVISAPVFAEIGRCRSIKHRGLTWPSTPAGSISVVACPLGSGSWLCRSSGEWDEGRPDLSSCQSRKNWSLDDALDLEEAVGKTINLYGGDIVPLLDLVASLTDQFRSTRSVTQARSLARTLSSLLDQRLDSSWQDLGGSQLLTSTVRRFMDVTEDLGAAIGEDWQKEEDMGVVVVVTSNIYFAVESLKANKGEDEGDEEARASVVLPPRFSLSVNQNYYSKEEFKERSTDSAVASSTVSIQLRPSGGKKISRHRVVFVSYLRLPQIFASGAVDPSNSIISLNVVPKLHRDEEHKAVVVILQLPLEPSSMEVECSAWPRVEAAGMGSSCTLAKWHNGSRECVCNGLSSYALNVTGVNDVMMDLREELTSSVDSNGGGGLFDTSVVEAGDAMTTTMVVIVAVSATLLVASVLSSALLVIYCRRVKIRDKKWEEEDSRPWWQRKSSPSSTSTASATSNSHHQLGSNDCGDSIHTSTSMVSGHRYPPLLMNEGASIISNSHYESALHATLRSSSSSRAKRPSAPSTWKRLLSTMMPDHHHQHHRSRPQLTLSRGSGLNAENTLRLEAHRQLFQFGAVNDFTLGHQQRSHHHQPYARQVHHPMVYDPTASSSSTTSIGQHVLLHGTTRNHHHLYQPQQQRLNDCQQNAYKSWRSPPSPPLLPPPQTADGIYQLPLDVDPIRPSYNKERPARHRHRSSSNNGLDNQLEPDFPAEDLWLLQQQRNKFQAQSGVRSFNSQESFVKLAGGSSKNNNRGSVVGNYASQGHIYMEVESLARHRSSSQQTDSSQEEEDCDNGVEVTADKAGYVVSHC